MRLIDADKAEQYFYEHLDDLHMAGAMNAINEMPTIEPNKWISVKDRLPKFHRKLKDGWRVSVNVLLWNKSEGYMTVGHYDYTNDCWCAEYDEPTHWMYLPKPPEKEKT